MFAAALIFFPLLGAAALLNYWVDPFGRFQQPKRPGVTETRSDEFIHAARDQQMRWLLRQGEQLDRKTVLIGNSKVLFGMDTCAWPEVERLSLLSLTNRETTRLLTVAGRHLTAPKTFLIQVGDPSEMEEPQAETRSATLWRDLLAWDTTKVSFANLRASHISQACAAMEVPTLSKTPFDQNRLLAQLKAGAVGMDDGSGISEILGALAPACQRFHSTIVLFTLPVFFSSAKAPELLSILDHRIRATRLAADSFVARDCGCRVVICDLATTYTQKYFAQGPPRTEWQNVGHFKPALGQELLKTIVAAANEP